MKMKIAFHSNQLGERGTEVALYDYALYNEVLLSNQSIIISNKNNDLFSLQKFRNRFAVYLYDNFSEVDVILKENAVDVFYAIKSGLKDHVISTQCKNVVHCVFTTAQPHGDVYASISPWLADQSSVRVPVVPHMVASIESPDDLRSELHIPEDAVVFGRYGGWEQFDLPFVHRTVEYISRRRKDIYFLFMNTAPFNRQSYQENNKQIIHLPKSSDDFYKAAFINTCDAMLHARYEGETFGLAIAEFSIRNKPVLTWSQSSQKAHLDILGEKCIRYHDEKDLFRIINNFNKEAIRKLAWDCYGASYNPQEVMKVFKQVFLD
ncbi:MAG: glycosyltransferase family 1 protein [Candidatus Margulisiibacteriota bacterium]|nr:MAG: glycosyltransferase family 1 protein [Candidatus Margulisiibacteriota bacterium]HCY38189.1 hypothetical protein [Candidatus Margulisiibacteriota bacterium]